MEEIALTDVIVEKEASPAELMALEEMMKAGLFWGRRKAKTHPRMKSFVFATRNGIEIIDLHQTKQLFEESLDFIKSKIADGGSVLLVGTTPAAKAVTEEFAKKLNWPYVAERWLGGILTNFKTLSKRISYFKKLKTDKAAGRFEKLTKKERLNIDREIEELTIKFSGVENMEKLPAVVFVIGATEHLTAVKEAKIMKIPVVAMVNTDFNPEIVDYAIPSNDRSKPAIEWVLSKLETASEEAKKQIVEKNDLTKQK
ncbi:MAG: 30S ribosomal protein S2 [Candidatus Pacebacteria bacterium]|nr:30S ribosomal protein S2 [Candidatus Paceibacterota bacterium]